MKGSLGRAQRVTETFERITFSGTGEGNPPRRKQRMEKVRYGSEKGSRLQDY